MKKRFVKIISAALSAAMIMGTAGCGGNGSQEAETPAAAPAETSAPEATAKPADGQEEAKGAAAGSTITMMASQNWIKDIDRELIEKFKEETGIQVKLLVTPDNGYSTLLGTSLADGSDVVDIFMYDAGKPMVSLGVPDMALDLSNEPWAANMEDWAVTANTYEDKLYGFSTWGVDYEGVLYNKTFFDENNLKPAETWEEFVALCDSIKELGKTPLYEPINGVWHTQSWFYSMTNVLNHEATPGAAEWLNESKDNKIASLKTAKEGLTQIAELLNAKDANGKPKYYTNDGQSEDWFGSYTSLQNRDTVMMVTYTAYPAELAANGCKDDWGMFPLPVAGTDSINANGGGISKYVNKYSQNVDACKAYLEFLAKPENLDTYYAARTDLVTAAFKGVTTVKPTNATNEALERSKEEPAVRIMNDMLYWDPDLYKYFQGFAAGTTTPDQFLENMDTYRATMFDAAATN